VRCLADAYHADHRADTLLVLLPPAKASLEDMLAQGMVAAVRELGLPLDILLADVGYQQVMAGTVASTLQQEVILPARQQGYAAIWLAGISLGAFNALHYAAVHGEQLAGIKLLAPYPGTADILQEIRAAGGPEGWAADPDCSLQDERRWWHWLAKRGERAGCPLWLSLAAEDRFAAGQDMLATLLLPAQVRRTAGDHSWPVWRAQWQHWLLHGPLSGKPAATMEDR